MRNLLFLAVRYLRFHRFRTVILLLTLTSLLYLPLAVILITDISQQSLTLRAESTPVIIGSRGSDLDLVMNALYFQPSQLRTVPYSLLDELNHEERGRPVPFFLGDTARGYPVAGTSPAYFSERNLRVAEGYMITGLGECVLGSRVAESLGLKPGDRIITDPENPYHLAGSYPLELKVTGILEASAGWDDRAIFTDIRTAWIARGLGHGHDELAGEQGTVLKEEKGNLVGNASVRMYNRIDPENRNDFHFHGSTADFPLSGILFFPDSSRSEAMILSAYGEHSLLQAVEPDKVILKLLDTLFRIREILNWVLGVTLTITTGAVVFILVLTVRLRKAESLTLYRMGGSRSLIVRLTAVETFILGIISFLISLLLLGVTWLFRLNILDLLIQ
ncbi:MAG: ABC transporter permease [Spirochaetales bacterium]|nr:ABC transporter permease [Spirochaetales bacterium]